jgi:hypothetical protein
MTYLERGLTWSGANLKLEIRTQKKKRGVRQGQGHVYFPLDLQPLFMWGNTLGGKWSPSRETEAKSIGAKFERDIVLTLRTAMAQIFRIDILDGIIIAICQYKYSGISSP